MGNGGRREPEGDETVDRDQMTQREKACRASRSQTERGASRRDAALATALSLAWPDSFWTSNQQDSKTIHFAIVSYGVGGNSVQDHHETNIALNW